MRGEDALYASTYRASVFLLKDGRHAGSGFFASPDGLIVTAAHIVKGKASGIEVVSPVAGRRKVERVAVDFGHDIALLRAPQRDEPYPSLAIAERMPSPGEDAFLFGDPALRHRLMLEGSVAIPKPTYCHPGTCYERVFYFTGTSPNGTSGGCWVDSDGRVIGVQSGYLNSAKAPAGIAMVGPPDAVRRLLKTQTSPQTSTLGSRLDELWTQPKGFIARFPEGTAGVVTVVPHKGGPVAEAGLNKESLITAIDGEPVVYIDDLMRVVRSKQPGDEVTLEVLDPDEKSSHSVTVRLGAVEE